MPIHKLYGLITFSFGKRPRNVWVPEWLASMIELEDEPMEDALDLRLLACKLCVKAKAKTESGAPARESDLSSNFQAEGQNFKVRTMRLIIKLKFAKLVFDSSVCNVQILRIVR